MINGYRGNVELIGRLHMIDGIYIKIVNTGRRPITLYALEFVFENENPKKVRLTKSIGERATDAFQNRDMNHPCLSESQFFEFVLDSSNFDFKSLKLENLKSINVLTSNGASKKLRALLGWLRKN